MRVPLRKQIGNPEKTIVRSDKHSEDSPSESQGAGSVGKDGWQSSPKNRIDQWIVDTWAFEIGSWIFSTILLMGIALTLALHDNQPLPNWPWGITINALVSLLSTFATSGLVVVLTSIIGQTRWVEFATQKRRISEFEIYDEASRGPLGSLRLLLRLKKFNLASLAALVIIFSLATGPFVQQVTVIEAAEVTAGTTSMLARKAYPNYGLPNMQNQVDNPLDYLYTPGFMTASIYRGLYSGGNSTEFNIQNAFQQQPSCPTGNCTYDDFDSLAICHACENITDLLIPKSNNTAWSWALPNNFSTHEEASPPGEQVFTDLVVSTGGAYNPLVLHAGLPIVNITAIQPCVAASGKPCAATAQECMLYWCMNNYRSQVVKGVFSQDILRTVKYGTTINANLLENDTYVFHANNSNQQGGLTDEKVNDILTVSKWGSASLTDLIADMLTIKVHNGLGFKPTEIFHGTASVSTIFPGVPLDMSPTFEAMATSMTNAVQSNISYADGMRTVQGQATKELPYLRVRWAWIVFPAVLQVMVLILLVYSVVKTSRQKLPIWKNSVLATMILGARVHRSLPENADSDRLMDMKLAADNVKIGQCQIFATGHVHRVASCAGLLYQGDGES